jgi:hypothetical protein
MSAVSMFSVAITDWVVYNEKRFIVVHSSVPWLRGATSADGHFTGRIPRQHRMSHGERECRRDLAKLVYTAGHS